MAYVSTTHSAITARGGAAFAEALTRLGARWSKYRMFRRTLAELSELTARERADLGLSQYNLRAAAYEAVYAQRD